MSRCWSCARPIEAGRYHEACLRELFGTPSLPRIDADLARLHTLALAMVGKVSLSGAQRKLSVQLTPDRATLQVAIGGGRYLLKPQAQTFPYLPENEWVTQRLAALCGIEVPSAALAPLADGSLAYVVRRFDRPAGGGKLAMEDFCQLTGRMPAEKYEGTAEQCAAVLRSFASEPLIEMRKLYRHLVFTWWVGNGDLHLKNLALLRAEDGLWRLSPAYDQLDTRLVIPDDHLAMPICGKRDKLSAETWRLLAERMGLGAKAAERILDELAAALPEMSALMGDSPLPAELREHYADQLELRRPKTR